MTTLEKVQTAIENAGANAEFHTDAAGNPVSIFSTGPVFPAAHRNVYYIDTDDTLPDLTIEVGEWWQDFLKLHQ